MKYLSSRLILRFGLLFGLLLMPVLAAADDPDQAPPSGRSAGGRGCGTTMPAEADVPNLILLASQGANQTVSTRPTFAWFVRDTAPVAMEFRLYAQTEYAQTGNAQTGNQGFELVKEIKDEQFQSAPGIMALAWDQTAPELAIGKYRWQVVLVCDRARPSSNLFATADVEVVPVPANLQAQLGQTRDPLSHAAIYAAANLWYDALATAIGSSRTALEDSRLSLLDKMTLNPTERQVLQESPIHLVQR